MIAERSFIKLFTIYINESLTIKYMLICIFCQKECKSPTAHKNHESRCPLNPDRKYVWPRGRVPWNKGLNKKSSPELADKLSAGGIAVANKWNSTNTKPFFATEEYWTEERRKQKSEWRKNLHKQDPNTHPNRKLAGNKNKMSYPEKVAYEYLQQQNIQFEHNKNILKYWVDFCIGTTIIEIDGSYWHSTEKDVARDAELKQLGYTVHRISAKANIHKEIENILRNVG